MNEPTPALLETTEPAAAVLGRTTPLLSDVQLRDHARWWTENPYSTVEDRAARIINTYNIPSVSDAYIRRFMKAHPLEKRMIFGGPEHAKVVESAVPEALLGCCCAHSRTSTSTSTSTMSGFGTSGSVGWDAPLPTSTSPAFNIDTAFTPADTSGLIDKTREVKVDANDYSRFKDIGADLDDKKSSSAAAAVAPQSVNDSCRNCHKAGAKLKCSVCKKAVYCARTCQASDWTFHKRICKKPEPPKTDLPRRPPPATKAATTSSSASSSSKPAAKSSSSTTTSSGSTEVVLDEPDLPSDVRGYKNGLPYFHRELSHDEKQLIGDIAPQKIEVAPTTAAAAASTVQHEGSAWNHAGTFEERMFTKWAEQKWSELFMGAVFTEGKLTATFSAPEKITGDASICVVRGKKRFLYDFNFTLPFEVAIDGGSSYKGNYTLREISNDEEYEIAGRLTKKPVVAADAEVLQKFIGTTSSGLQKEVLRLIAQFAQEYQSQ